MANEKRLIDANRLKRRLERFEEFMVEFGNVEAAKATRAIIKGLKIMPTEDAVEVVHSSWILNDDGSGTCKHCHRTTKSVWDCDNWMNHCPNCGANMKGE